MRIAIPPRRASSYCGQSRGIGQRPVPVHRASAHERRMHYSAVLNEHFFMRAIPAAEMQRVQTGIVSRLGDQDALTNFLGSLAVENWGSKIWPLMQEWRDGGCLEDFTRARSEIIGQVAANHAELIAPPFTDVWPDIKPLPARQKYFRGLRIKYRIDRAAIATQSAIVMHDEVIESLQKYLRRRLPKMQPEQSAGMYFLIGPRAIGKRTMMRTLAHELFGAGGFFYVDCNSLRSTRAVEELMHPLLAQWSRRVHDGIVYFDNIEQAADALYSHLPLNPLLGESAEDPAFAGKLIIAASDYGLTDKFGQYGLPQSDAQRRHITDEIKAALSRDFEVEMLYRLNQVCVMWPLSVLARARVAEKIWSQDFAPVWSDLDVRLDVSSSVFNHFALGEPAGYYVSGVDDLRAALEMDVHDELRSRFFSGRLPAKSRLKIHCQGKSLTIEAFK